MKIRLKRCFMCGKIKFTKRNRKYARIEYPNKKSDGFVLAIKFICNDCLISNSNEYQIERLKRDESITLYDLERLGLIKKLKGEIV